MTYWISMGAVLLIGYCLVKWSGRADELSKVSSTGDDGGTASLVDTRASRTDTRSPATDNGKNESDRGGEA
jgi:hypothetical protein